MSETESDNTLDNFGVIQTPSKSAESTNDIQSGFLLETFMNHPLWARWEYWMRTLCYGYVSKTRPLPKVPFESAPDPKTLKMLEDTIRIFWNKEGINGIEAIRLLTHFIKYGLGAYAIESRNPDIAFDPKNVKMETWIEVKKTFDFKMMLDHPQDYFAILYINHAGKQKNFIPTPMHIGSFLAAMCFSDETPITTKCLDPCCGTGSLLLLMTNYSINTHGIEISSDLCNLAKLNCWIYAPMVIMRPKRQIEGIDSDPEMIECKDALLHPPIERPSPTVEASA